MTIGTLSGTGVKVDGKTTFATPMLRGRAQPGALIDVSIDAVPVGRVRGNARTGAWMLPALRLANGANDVTVVADIRQDKGS